MQVYIITHAATSEQRIIEAPNRASALRHVAESDYSVNRASTSEALKMQASGVKVEKVESK